MTCFCCTLHTAFGAFSLATNEKLAVVATCFGDSARLAENLTGGTLIYDERKTLPAAAQFKEFFAGKRRHFDLSLHLEGSPFQKRVWKALCQIPYGQTTSYGALARSLGSSARAVGRANGSNPACIVVPCHRVIGADGSLTGFAYGTDLKSRLLELEGSLQPSLLQV